MRLVHEGHVISDFEGWAGDTVFELDNGTKWQQTRYAYRYYYRYRPLAKIWEDGSRFLLEVDGVSEMLEVRKLI